MCNQHNVVFIFFVIIPFGFFSSRKVFNNLQHMFVIFVPVRTHLLFFLLESSYFCSCSNPVTFVPVGTQLLQFLFEPSYFCSCWNPVTFVPVRTQLLLFLFQSSYFCSCWNPATFYIPVTFVPVGTQLLEYIPVTLVYFFVF